MALPSHKEQAWESWGVGGAVIPRLTASSGPSEQVFDQGLLRLTSDSSSQHLIESIFQVLKAKVRLPLKQRAQQTSAQCCKASIWWGGPTGG